MAGCGALTERQHFGSEFTGRPEGQRPIDKRAREYFIDWAIDDLRDPEHGMLGHLVVGAAAVL